MAKQEEKKYGAPANALASDAYPAATTEPDAKFYAQQPTSEPIAESEGEVPAGRFSEQVLKSEAGSGAADSHPEENRPALGVEGDESSGSKK